MPQVSLSSLRETLLSIAISKPIEPIKIDIRPTYFPPVIEKDPHLEALGKKVFRDAEKSNQEKWNRGHSGIAGIMGGDPKFYGK